MTGTKISTLPYKGARDFYPEDMLIRNYIFDVWKKIPKRFGFEEYDFPILEPLETFSSKTGEEIVKNQLFSFEDKGGRKLAIRPELTPGTVRMLAKKFNELPQPIKWFMIGNNWRYERPQKGRGREFYQLEVNIFGVSDITADFEIFQIIIDLMKELGAKEGMFEVMYSDRRLVLCLLKELLSLDDETANKVRSVMDKKSKVSEKDFMEMLLQTGITREQSNTVRGFMESSFEDLENLSNNEGYKTLLKLRNLLDENGLSSYCRFDPSIVRGFDYSDGLVYEVYDKNPNNRRSLFGGERFDKLINIFGDFDMPATGFAMGDWTLLEFLNNWNLLPTFESSVDYFVTLWPGDDSSFLKSTLAISKKLRNNQKNVLTWIQPNSKLDKQLKYADKKGAKYAVIIGENELKTKTVTLKDLTKQTQETLAEEDFLSKL